MAKSINWPKGFEQAILAEDTEQVYCAIRPGRIYYDNPYWVDSEIVDIRADQQVVRKGVIVGDLKCCAIQDLTPDDFAKHKPGLQNMAALIQHLNDRYSKPITPSDEVTVVYYCSYGV